VTCFAWRSARLGLVGCSICRSLRRRRRDCSLVTGIYSVIGWRKLWAWAARSSYCFVAHHKSRACDQSATNLLLHVEVSIIHHGKCVVVALRKCGFDSSTANRARMTYLRAWLQFEDIPARSLWFLIFGRHFGIFLHDWVFFCDQGFINDRIFHCDRVSFVDWVSNCDWVF
jgi:hypothetical protein